MLEEATASARTEPAEQGLNRVQTGLPVLKKVAEFVLEGIKAWREYDQHPVLLFRGLAELTLAHPEKGEAGFTSLELEEVVRKIQGQPELKEVDTDEVSRKVRKRWNKLVSLWPSKIQGLRQQAQKLGLDFVPDIERMEGGGSGNPTRYFLTVKPIEADVPEHVVAAQAALTSGSLLYICEDLRDAGPVVRRFASGIDLTGWRRWTFFVLLFGVVGSLALLGLVLVANIWIQVPMEKLIYLTISIAGISWSLWVSFGFLFQVRMERIMPAPWWLQSIEDDHMMEWHGAPRYTHSSIKLSRYCASCPICHGRVSVVSGGRAFNGRLIGRCEESPKEHIYTFDHITREGRPLRSGAASG